MTYIVTIDWIWHARALWLNSSSLIVENMLILEGDVVALVQCTGWRTEDIGRMGHVIRRSRKHAQTAKSHGCVYLFLVWIHFAHAQTPTQLTTTLLKDISMLHIPARTNICLTYTTSLSFRYGTALGILAPLKPAKQLLCGVPERGKSVKKRLGWVMG